MPIFFYPANPTLPVSLESIGNQWDQPFVSRADGYPCYHWLQTESGRGEINIDNQKLILDKGDGILIPPFVPHSYRSLTSRWLTSFATFHGYLLQNLHQSIGRKSFYTACDSEQFSFLDWTGQLVQSRDLDEQAVSMECYRFLLNFVQGSLGREQHHPLFQQYVQPAIETIEKNYSEEITVQSLAASMYISPQYLNRLFQRFLSRSTYQYLLEVRLSRSKELLADGRGTEIQDIAAATGFSDSSHFSKTFKKHTGYTPAEFRRIFH